MDFSEIIKPGITAVIGGGGKTTFLRRVGELLSKRYTVLLCTTTKIRPFADLPFAGSLEELDQLRQEHSLICAGQLLPELGKVVALDVPMEQLTSRFDIVLVEADGSAQRPMKAHAPHEPVIPVGCRQVIYLIGASGFGRPIAEAAHRPERYAELAGVSINARITPEIAAKVLRAEKLHDMVLINQVETAEQAELARRFASLMECPVIAGALQRGEFFKCES